MAINSARQILLTPEVPVPAREAWLYRNASALGKVRDGIAQAGRVRPAASDCLPSSLTTSSAAVPAFRALLTPQAHRCVSHLLASPAWWSASDHGPGEVAQPPRLSLHTARCSSEWIQFIGGGLLLYVGAEWFIGGASAFALPVVFRGTDQPGR